jgi:hydroxymethylbilane synthase
VKSRLILGSRGSQLALAQVRLVQEALLGVHPGLTIEVKTITTSGDERQEVKAGEGSAAGLKGLFTKEIQEALLAGTIDAAVHSLKDLPGITPPELELAAVLPRADTADLLISMIHGNLAALPAGARVGTGSIRRRRQLRWLRPSLEIVELRGNVPTRLQKLVGQGLDAIVLARAGLDRLGYKISGGLVRCDAGSFRVSTLDILPAIGQGVVGIEIRKGDEETREVLAGIDHAQTHTCVRVERELLRLLDGDCKLPVAARATLDGAGMLHATALIFPDDNALPPAQATASGPASLPAALALTLFQQLSLKL